MINEYREIFCSTSVKDIKRALSDNPSDSYKIDFNLFPATYVTHQGMTIFKLNKQDGRGQDMYMTRNPLIVGELTKAGYSTMKSVIPSSGGKMTEEGTPFANPGNVNMPYIQNFLKSEEAHATNQRLERNRKVDIVGKDVQHMNDADFENRHGFTKVEFKVGKYEDGFLNQTYV